jgi:hypothetical protein
VLSFDHGVKAPRFQLLSKMSWNYKLTISFQGAYFECSSHY